MEKITIQYIWATLFNAVAIGMSLQGYYPFGIVLLLLGLYFPFRELVNTTFIRTKTIRNFTNVKRFRYFFLISLGPMGLVIGPQFGIITIMGFIASVYLDSKK